MNQRHSRRAVTFFLAALAGWTGLLGFPTADAQQWVSPRRIGFLLVISSHEGKELQAFRLKIAKALGISIFQSILVRADEVIR